MWQSRCPNLYPIFSAFHSSGVKPVLYNRMRRGRRRRSGCWLTLFSTLRCRSRSLPRRWPRFGLARLGKVAQCIIGVVKICTYEIVKNMNYTSHMFDKKVAWISCMFEIYRVNPHCAGGSWGVEGTTTSLTMRQSDLRCENFPWLLSNHTRPSIKPLYRRDSLFKTVFFGEIKRHAQEGRQAELADMHIFILFILHNIYR